MRNIYKLFLLILFMGERISHAGGLERELDQRFSGRWAVSAPESKTEEKQTVTTRQILVDSQPIGTLTVRTYKAGDVERVYSVFYDGKMPGYDNPGRTPTISMRATEKVLGRGISPDDGTQPNDTPKIPLYRYDYHALGLADHEVLAGKEDEYAKALAATALAGAGLLNAAFRAGRGEE